MTTLRSVSSRYHVDVVPVPESLVDADGEPCTSRDVSRPYPLAAECQGCGLRIELADRGIFTDWEHANGSPPPRRPTVPPPRPIR